MPRVTYFDMNVDDTGRAMKFYSQVFGWKFEKWKGPFEYWLAMTGDEKTPGINGGLAKREDPSAHIMNFIDVVSVDDSAEKIIAGGGKILQAKQAIPGVGYIAIFQDTENNMFGILQPDESARQL